VLAKVISNTRGSANVEPDAIVMHPVNWLSTRLLKDGTGGTVGQFYGGGPFTGAYGNAGAPCLFGEMLWGKRARSARPLVLIRHWSARSQQRRRSPGEVARRSRPRTHTRTTSSKTS
jgi:hypothetical protein